MRRRLAFIALFCGALYALTGSGVDLARFKDARIERLLVRPAHAQNFFGISGDTKVPSGPSKSYSYLTNNQTNACGSPQTFTGVNLGSATSKFFIVMIGTQNAPETVSYSINETALSFIAADANTTVDLFTGTAMGGTNSTTVLTGASCDDRIAQIWTASGLSSTTPVSHPVNNGGGVTVNVQAGDFLFALAGTGTGNLSPSTQAPARQDNISPGLDTIFFQSGDWTVASPNASFSVTTTEAGGGSAVIAANFR